MKHYFTLTLLVFFFSFSDDLFAQQATSFTNPSEQPDGRPAPNLRIADFVPGEVLVKFKDDVQVSFLKSGGKLKTANTSLNKVFDNFHITDVEKLFPGEQRLKSKEILTAPNGQQFKRPSLHNIYSFTLLKSQNNLPPDIFKAIEELKTLPEVEYAEPNYIFSVDDLNPIGPVLSSADLVKLQNKSSENTSDGSTPNDPLYSQQWYIPAVKADLVWAQTTGDTSQIIAILDTGIDWKHPDLMNKIWINQSEIPDNNIDDDGNGLIDDIRGWDYINNDNNPMDDNSHGTHVAGIAAAETNNAIGIAGVCPKAEIMPIKVFTSKGTGDVSTIVGGINYAANHGATVINMSFGSYARSFTMENALANAYATAVLVAAAGNDSYSIYDMLPSGLPTIFYPAALSFVFGVQADEAYSNYDPDGPVYSEYLDEQNYELKAPGSALSTVPNGNYRVFHGTSMASPIISGAIALYLSIYPEKSAEELWSDFTHSSNNGIVDLNNAFFSTTKIPQLDLFSFIVNDENDGNDKDNKPDAGETVNLILKIRNTGSPANAVYAQIKTADDGNPNHISILKDTVQFGNIGIFRSLTNEMNPFKIKISNNCNNNSFVSLDVLIHNNTDTTVFVQNVKFKIYNGSELSGILLRDTVLTPDKNWVISNSLRISTNVTVTVLPGTNVEINAGVDNRGIVNFTGTADSLIFLKGIVGGNCIYRYVNIDLKGGGLSGSDFENCIIKNVLPNFSANSLTNCVLENSEIYSALDVPLIKNCLIQNSMICYFAGDIDRCVINNIHTQTSNRLLESRYTVYNKIGDVYSYIYPNWPNLWRNEIMFFGYTSLIKNSFLKNGINLYYVQSNGSADWQDLPEQYWGTTNKKEIKKKYIDFNDNAGLPYLIIDPMLTSPSDSCHAHVWKVLVNGKDAQDEVADPVGVGKQRFDVYFNRAMNKSVTPKLSFGGIYPYTSNPINEEISWSEDGKIFTAYKTIKLTIGDGINHIRVAGAKEANGWDFEIPVEDDRFSFIISAANSASADFLATQGLGKVKLEWNNSGLEDGLGYNMYRMEHINDSTLTAPILVNSTMITDTLYTDFSVVPNKKYYYYYKILRTNLAETDSSKVVSAIPFTASKGDANGDLSVNVLDVTSIVSYLLNQNPQPFIFEAADINSDNTINILDVISAVNKITGGEKKSIAGAINIPPAYIYLDKNEISFKTQYPVSALQFELQGSGIENITLSSKQKGFELVYALKDGKLTGILFSFGNKSLPTELSGIISLKGDCSGLKWGNLLGGDAKGNPVKVIPDELHTYSLADCDLSAYPNPFSQSTTIKYSLHEAAYVQLEVYDMYGRLVETVLSAEQQKGEYQQIWKGTSSCKQGFYFCRLTAKTAAGITTNTTAKLLKIGK
jgi:subtilisin family serine protease